MEHDKALARLEALMLLAAREACATRAAVFVPNGRGLALVAQLALDQAALDLAHSGWARHRTTLYAGKTVRYGRAALWPLVRDGHVCALMYLDSAPEPFPDDDARQTGAQIAATMRHVTSPTPVVTYLSCGLTHVEAMAEIQGDQIAVLLALYHGNVTAVARQLGVNRDTVYARAHRAGLDLAEFRPRRLRPA